MSDLYDKYCTLIIKRIPLFIVRVMRYSGIYYAKIQRPASWSCGASTEGVYHVSLKNLHFTEKLQFYGNQMLMTQQ